MAQATTTETPARRAVRSPLALIEAVALSRVSQVQPEGTKLLALARNSTVCPGEMAAVSGVRVTAGAKPDAGTATTAVVTAPQMLGAFEAQARTWNDPGCSAWRTPSAQMSPRVGSDSDHAAGAAERQGSVLRTRQPG